MFKLAKLIFTLIIVLAIAVVGYNAIWGTAEEKESSRTIVAKVHDLSKSVGGLLKSEKDKFDKGKYDSAIGKMKNAFALIKKRASEMASGGEAVLSDLDSLQRREQELEAKLRELESGGAELIHDESIDQIREELIQINQQADALATSIEST